MTDAYDLYIQRVGLLKQLQGEFPSNLSPSAKIVVQAKHKENTPLKELWEAAYYDTHILQRGTVQDSWLRFVDSISDQPRLELTLFVGAQPRGYACIVLDFDQHCGWCWSVQWNFVHPKYRGSSLFRKVLATLRELNRKTQLPYAYSQMQPDGIIKITYRGIH